MPRVFSNAAKVPERQLKGQNCEVFKLSDEQYNNRYKKLDALLDEAQEFLNEDYIPLLNEEKPLRFKFAIGSDVLVLSDGLFRQGQVVSYYQTVVTDTHPRGPGLTKAKLPATEWIPTLLIQLTGVPKKYTVEIAENEMITRRNPKQKGDLQGLLVAHHWNQLYCEWKGFDEEALEDSGFFMEDRAYAVVEKAWQTACKVKGSFASYIK